MAAKRSKVYTIAFIGVMSAVVFVSNYFSIPVASSRIHLANAVCMLAGMLFGGLQGGLAAGLGSALFDITFPAYAAEAWITFLNKGLMALVCGLIVHHGMALGEKKRLRLVLGALAGAVLYIGLYMLKSYVQMSLLGMERDALLIKMGEKLLASLVNGTFAVIAAPLLYTALHPALVKAGMYREITVK